ncbi:hypothetical protein GCM10011391_28280 [Pullulanibacillus camelliae]|uniref:Uncharacterized protein n=1 Tax=Pullulanibacillus camelliae TaxID=1707096 RepID=A0A8J2YKE2_9BACL|nr:hypothetical protein [Pullulanibacillus camelliae]GGE47863.1 hypothetical protein GCM10011391_28280 [Pullulanibacillus camelliae]
MKTRQKGDRYRPVVTVSKVKQGGPRNGLPTVIQMSGETYVLAHKDQRPKGEKR